MGSAKKEGRDLKARTIFKDGADEYVCEVSLAQIQYYAIRELGMRLSRLVIHPAIPEAFTHGLCQSLEISHAA